MSDSSRHTRVTAELAAYSRPTGRILKASLVELLGETVPEEGIIEFSAEDGSFIHYPVDGSWRRSGVQYRGNTPSADINTPFGLIHYRLIESLPAGHHGILLFGVHPDAEPTAVEVTAPDGGTAIRELNLGEIEIDVRMPE